MSTPLASFNQRTVSFWKIACLLAIAIVALPSQVSGSGAWCTPPYVQVAGPDSSGGNPGGLHIQSLSMGEPFVSCSARSLTVVMKVDTLDPGHTGHVTPPPNTQWEAEFVVPRNLLSPEPDSDQTIFVSWDTNTVPTGGFNYGFLNKNVTTIGPVQSAAQYTSQCSPTSSTCAATGTVAPDGTITINLDMTSPLNFKDVQGNLRFTMPALPAGWELTFIAGNIWTCACAAGNGTPVNVSATHAFQNYAVHGNLSCSIPPVSADPPVAALTGSPTSGNAPLTVNFDASGSTIAPGGCGTISSYNFDFGDGKKVTQSTPTASHTYSIGGNYPARVTVTSLAGVTSTNNAEVDIAVASTMPPTVQIVRDDVYVANGVVFAIVAVGNTLYFGGAFSQVGPATGSAVPVDSTSGLPVTGFPKVVGSVSAVAADGSGGWFIGGNFTSVGGVPRSNIAHVMADNTVSAWNPIADDVVNALVVNGSTIYAGGAFTSIGGQTRNSIAALNATTGLATSWNPNATGTVYALAVNSSTVYVGGTFTNIGGQARNNIAALDATTATATGWNPNANNTVFALAVSNSTVYAGGDFTSIGGQSRNRIAALDASSGQAAMLWNPNASNTVLALAVSNGAVYAGGSFATIGGQPRNHIAELDVATGLANPVWNPNTNGDVFALAVNGTTVYAGGRFTNIGGQIRDYIAALDATGTSTAWNPKMNNPVSALGINGSIVYAGGSFTSVGGQDRNNLAALDTITGQVTPWNPSANSTVWALAADSSTVYAGGFFSSVGGQERTKIAALDPISGAPTAWDASTDNLGFIFALALNGSTLYAGGSFASIGGQPRNNIAALDRSSAQARSWDANADGWVEALAVSGPLVYAGGDFANIGGQTRRGIAALDSTTGLATSWNADANGGISALLVSGSTVYVGGVFSNIGGLARNNLAALDTTTGFAEPFSADAKYRVSALALSGSTLYAGGYFTTIGGQSRNRIAALDFASGFVAPWDPNVDPNLLPPFFFQSVNAVAVSGETVFAGGNFTSVGGLPHSYIAGIKAVTPVQLVSAVSRKVHGSSGTFDILLRGQDPPPPGNLSIECRSGGANGNYTLVFSFANPLTSVDFATVSSGTGSAPSGAIDSSDAHNYVVNLTGVANAQYITVSLTNVADSVGNFSSAVSASMGVLLGDVNGNGRTDNGDAIVVRNLSGTVPTDTSTARADVNCSGRIDNGDAIVIRNNSGNALPP
jgi:trimeric autotransporter adhesin